MPSCISCPHEPSQRLTSRYICGPMSFLSDSTILQRGQTSSMRGKDLHSHYKTRKEIHMNNSEQPQPLLEREDIQEVGEKQLEDVSGGVLMTPGRGILQRSHSAPGRLQGNHYLTPTASPASHVSSRSASSRSTYPSGDSVLSSGSDRETDHWHVDAVYPASRSRTPSP